MMISTGAWTNVSTYLLTLRKRKKKYDKVYEKPLLLCDGELVNGTVVGITNTDVVLNIGFKSDGLISLNEFQGFINLKVGDEVGSNRLWEKKIETAT